MAAAIMICRAERVPSTPAHLGKTVGLEAVGRLVERQAMGDHEARIDVAVLDVLVHSLPPLSSSRRIC